MLKNIPRRHVKRIFPYEFYNDIYENLTHFVAENKAFLYRRTSANRIIDKEHPEQQFENFRKMMYDEELAGVALQDHNIYSVDQGDYLILDQFIKTEDIIDFIKGEHVDRYVMLVQIFDENEEPILTKEGTLTTIRETPKAVITDDNLAILLMKTLSAEDDESFDNVQELGVIKAPQHLIDKLMVSPNVERTDKFE